MYFLNGNDGYYYKYNSSEAGRKICVSELIDILWDTRPVEFEYPRLASIFYLPEDHPLFMKICIMVFVKERDFYVHFIRENEFNDLSHFLKLGKDGEIILGTYVWLHKYITALCNYGPNSPKQLLYELNMRYNNQRYFYNELYGSFFDSGLILKVISYLEKI